MPNFYAKEIIKQDSENSHGYPYCTSKWLDWALKPLIKWGLNGCKSIKEYGYKTDSDGNPLISEC